MGLEWYINEGANSLIELKDLEDDPDLTPKARRQVPRTMSAGAFLKVGLVFRCSKHLGRPEITANFLL